MPFTSAFFVSQPVVMVVRHSLKILAVLFRPVAFLLRKRFCCTSSVLKLNCGRSCFCIMFFWFDFMKNIRLTDRIQNSITNNSMYSFNYMLERIFKYPDWVLVIVWVCYALLDFISMVILGRSFDPVFASANLVLGFAFSCIMYYILLPYILLKGKWISGLFFVAGLVIILSGLKFSIVFSGTDSQVTFGIMWLEFLRMVQFNGVTIFLWMLLAYFILLKDSREKKHLMEEMEVQHKSLQLGPHFVLNMMNEIMVKARGFCVDLTEDIEQFSTVLKYSYKDLERENTLLEELTALKAYAYCQHKRFGETLHLLIKSKFNEKSASRLPLPKMVLLTLFFDIFKHGDYRNDVVPCQVSYLLSDPEVGGKTVFAYTIFNKRMEQFALEESGFGIKTVSNILSYYFEEDFQLFYTSTDEEFSLMLLIDYG